MQELSNSVPSTPKPFYFKAENTLNMIHLKSL